MAAIVVEGHFRCPKCKRKTLVEHMEAMIVDRKVREFVYGYSTEKFEENTGTGLAWSFDLVGSPDYPNIDEVAHSWRCKGCDFIVPVRNREELLEWLTFHKMAEVRNYGEDTWPLLRWEWINKGLISRKLLKLLHGSTYVPPTRDEALKQYLATKLTKV